MRACVNVCVCVCVHGNLTTLHKSRLTKSFLEALLRLVQNRTVSASDFNVVVVPRHIGPPTGTV